MVQFLNMSVLVPHIDLQWLIKVFQGISSMGCKLVSAGNNYMRDTFIECFANGSISLSSYCGSTSSGWVTMPSNGYSYHGTSQALRFEI